MLRLFSGVGIVLITVSGVAWRLTAHDAPSCRMMLGIGGSDEGGAEPNRRFVPRLPPSYGRPHHPYAGKERTTCHNVCDVCALCTPELTCCSVRLCSHDVPRVPVPPASTVVPSLDARLPPEAASARPASQQHLPGSGPRWPRRVPAAHVPFSCWQHAQVRAYFWSHFT